MSTKFALVRENGDGTFDFVPGIDGKIDEVSDDEMEEYRKFWDPNEEKLDISFNELVGALYLHFKGGRT